MERAVERFPPSPLVHSPGAVLVAERADKSTARGKHPNLTSCFVVADVQRYYSELMVVVILALGDLVSQVVVFRSISGLSHGELSVVQPV
jgi:hypothetical protein